MAVSAPTLHADSERGRVVLVDTPATLSDAVITVLEPWQLQVEIADEGVLADRMPGSQLEARALAEKRDARAVIWITSNEDGTALWIFDRAEDRVIVRKLAASAPLDEPTAASVALTIKTLLKLSTAAPQDERFGAPEGPSASPAAPRKWQLETGAGLRHSLQDDGSSELRLDVAVARQLGAHFHLSAGFQTGPGRDVSEGPFDGHYSDTTVGASAAYWEPHGDWRLGVGIGAELHLVAIRGTLDSGALARASRINPALGASIHLRHRLVGSMNWGLYARSRYFPRRQRYLVDGDPVLELPAADVQIGALVALPFY